MKLYKTFYNRKLKQTNYLSKNLLKCLFLYFSYTTLSLYKTPLTPIISVLKVSNKLLVAQYYSFQQLAKILDAFKHSIYFQKKQK